MTEELTKDIKLTALPVQKEKCIDTKIKNIW